MPSQTRAQQCQAFNHVLDNVLERGDGSTLKVALIASGFDTMCDLMGIMINQIENLGYTTTLAPTMAGGADERKDEEASPSTSGPPVMIYVVPSDQNLIRYLRAYWHYRHASGSSIEDWNSVTQDEFDAFRINPDIDIKLLKPHEHQVLLQHTWSRTQHLAMPYCRANLLRLRFSNVASSAISRSSLRLRMSASMIHGTDLSSIKPVLKV
jgi:hypothetical protein